MVVLWWWFYSMTGDDNLSLSLSWIMAMVLVLLIPQWEWLANKMGVLGSFGGKQSVLLVCNSYLEDYADCGGVELMIVIWPSLYVHPRRNAWSPNESDYPIRWECWDPLVESNLSFWCVTRTLRTMQTVGVLNLWSSFGRHCMSTPEGMHDPPMRVTIQLDGSAGILWWKAICPFGV
jgi:hypothetical protein